MHRRCSCQETAGEQRALCQPGDASLLGLPPSSALLRLEQRGDRALGPLPGPDAQDGEGRSHPQYAPCTLEHLFNIFSEPSPCVFHALAQQCGCSG